LQEGVLYPFQLPRWQLTDCCESRPNTLAVSASPDGHEGSGGETPHEAVRNFPPPPPDVSPIEGLIDTHFHSGPDVFGRSLDDEQGARLYRDKGMEAVVLKNAPRAAAGHAWRTD
jgi:hypothetical protein